MRLPGTVAQTVGPLSRQSGIEAVRQVLVGLVVVGLFGLIGAVVSYRADVAEARVQVRDRVERQGLLYADSLALHFEVIKSELQRLAEHPMNNLENLDEEVRLEMNDDRSLFGGGTALLRLDGTRAWTDPVTMFPKEFNPSAQSWFQRMLAGELVAIDSLGPRQSVFVVAVPVRHEGRLRGVLVGVVNATDRFLFGAGQPGEQLLLLGADDGVLVPLVAPQWSQSREFDNRVDALLSTEQGQSWTIDGRDLWARAFKVRGTALRALAIEAEETAIAPIRRRLIPQLAFLAVLQITTLGAFTLFLRRTYRTFLEVEARVAEQEKMAALGSAASLIAHEVKNSLNGLNAATALLGSGGDPALVSRTLRGQVDRLGHLARSLLSFSKPADVRNSAVQLDLVAREAAEGLRPLPEFSEAALELQLNDPLAVSADPLLLLTALDNLIRNAIEAAVEAKDLGRTEHPHVVVAAFRDGSQAVLSVNDNAGGPPDGFEQRLGEPFFTTKARGIGLGLTMTRRAVASLGGELRFSRTAEGSRFEVRLPLA